MTAAFHDILQSSAGHIAIAGHAGVNRLILCHVLGIPLANLFRIGQDYGCLNIIRSSGSGYQVQLVNVSAGTDKKTTGGMPNVR
ncbi:metal dependent phosphohydrolase [Acetonema longum DSM 6540]|uniref:Metal dependent phosphohydrolase n=1 Tax=Acetonema longum DSM 6540 TaxID=1009370 RepID=F7NED2_9FIRM|nr:metal dependent phosphohydrolase [Acetonema longum DSM 6540]